MAALPMRPAIYTIVNLINGNQYIGSTKDARYRRYDHFTRLRAGRHANPRLQNAFNLYGEHSFEYRVVEFVANLDDLIIREQFYLDTLLPAYNTRKIAERNKGVPNKYKGLPGRKHTLAERLHQSEMLKGRPRPREAIEKMRAKQKGVLCPQRGNGKRGIKKSREAVEKMRASKLGKKTGPLPQSVRDKMKLAQKLRGITPQNRHAINIVWGVKWLRFRLAKGIIQPPLFDEEEAG